MQKKSLAVMTMIRGDHHWAKLWLAHYRAQVERPSDLYVILHGEDPYLQQLFTGCSVMVLPLHDAGHRDFERRRLDFEHYLIRGLQGYYHCVLMVDVDEFVVTAPEVDAPLCRYLPDVHDGEMVRSPLGFEVVEPPESGLLPLDLEAGLLSQGRALVCSGHYSKPCAFFLNFGVANHHRVIGAPWVIDPDLLLFHMRFADRGLMEEYATTRKAYFREQEASGSASSNSWKTPWQQYRKLLKQAKALPAGELDAVTRKRLRGALLDGFRDKGRVPTVVSGVLSAPPDVAALV